MGEVKRFTRAEVAARSGKNNTPVWFIVRDKVYDATTYIHEHPGGGDLILEFGGQDATRDFDDAAHSKDAISILAKYDIGEIVEEEKYYDANGKKKKRVVAAKPDGKDRSCLNLISCGMLG